MLSIEVVSNDFPSIAASLSGAVNAVVRETALGIDADAKLLAPVDTGFLRSSIQTEMDGEFSAIVNVGAHYAAYVEFGTSRMRAQPFLTPAVELNGARMMNTLGMLERML